MMSRPPNYEFQEWWNRERDRALSMSSPRHHYHHPTTAHHYDHPSIAAATTTTTSTVEITPTTPAGEDKSKGKGHGRSARQLSWLLCLRLHHSLSILLSLLSRLLSLLFTAIRRLTTSPYSDSSSSRLYRLIRAFLILALFLLLLELAAYFKGWHFSPPSYSSSTQALELLYASWLHIRAHYLAPPLQAMANVCIVLFLVQSLDRILLMLGCIWIRFKRIRPVASAEYMHDDDDDDDVKITSSEKSNDDDNNNNHNIGDVEEGVAAIQHRHHRSSSSSEVYPMILLQIPMCNEREVYRQSIAAVCIQDWPKDRMLVQVLDDSDDMDVQQLIKAEVQKWQQKGINILYRHRLIRTGYKAGNLKSAMICDYVKNYEFIAIFDADFQPGQDFLKRTIPHFKGNDDLALVQTRWAFVNKDENLLTGLQNINLSFHFEVEQQVNGILINFFGFNGTAGVWRIKARGFWWLVGKNHC